MITALPAVSYPQILFGSAMIAVSGAAIGWVKGVPQQAWAWLRRRFSVQVYTGNESPIYDPVYRHIASAIDLRWIRKFSAIWHNDEVRFSPGLGTQYFFYRRTLVEMTRSVEKTSGGKVDSLWDELAKAQLVVKPESMTLTFFTRDKSIPLRFMQEATGCLKSTASDKKLKIYTPNYASWYSRGELDLRGPKTVILPGNQMEELLTDLADFFQREVWYKSLGIPWKRGYLFYGVPGSGKSSTIAALCKQVKLDIYTLSLNSQGDDRLRTLVNSIPPRCALVLEDLDVLYRKEDRNLSLSALLNVLDGLTYANGTIVFATTNHLDQLDPALIRRGRFDVHVKFSNVTEDQVARFLRRFYGREALRGEPAMIAAKGISMAELQNVCLENMEDLDAACAQVLSPYAKYEPVEVA